MLQRNTNKSILLSRKRAPCICTPPLPFALVVQPMTPLRPSFTNGTMEEDDFSQFDKLGKGQERKLGVILSWNRFTILEKDKISSRVSML